MEKRKVSFKELGLVVTPGRELWGPKRMVNQAYTSKCAEILEAEAKKKPLYRVSMEVDHSTRQVVFSYFPIDFVFEERMRKVNSIMEKAKVDKIKRDWNELVKKGGQKK